MHAVVVQGTGNLSTSSLQQWLQAEGLPQPQALQRLTVFSGKATLGQTIPLQVRSCWALQLAWSLKPALNAQDEAATACAVHATCSTQR